MPDDLGGALDRIAERVAQGFAVQPWRYGVLWPESALVQHLGGVWQALVDTVHPPPGEPGEWRLVVEGIRRLASYQEPLDPRQYGLTVALSSGHEVQVVELATEGNATATILCRASPEPLRSQILIADLGPR